MMIVWFIVGYVAGLVVAIALYFKTVNENCNMSAEIEQLYKQIGIINSERCHAHKSIMLQFDKNKRFRAENARICAENARLRAELASYKSSEITAGAIRQSADEAEKPFDWEGFKAGKFAVHCDTEEKAKAFLNECAEQGIRWCTGQDCRKYTLWDAFNKNTCYDCEGNPCCIQYEHIKGENIKVISYTFPDTADNLGSSGTTE